MSNSFTQFEATVPVVKPATSEVIYDKYWMTRMMVNAENSTKPISMRVFFTPARDVTIEKDGETISYKETMQSGSEKVLIIKDIFQKAAEDVEFAATMDAVFKVLKRIATDEAVL